jgi:dihydropteroate synthase
MSAYLQHSINCKGRLLSLERPKVMGILNATPDSFFDGGKYDSSEEALKRVKSMLDAGADIIDIGGYSSRPGAAHISVEEELQRTIPLVKRIHERFPEAILSIDTFRSTVAKAAIEAGASIVNDISAGDHDPLMLETVAKLAVPYIIMHKQGNPETMQDNPEYDDVVHDVFDYLFQRKKDCNAAGIVDIIIDPGFGFGKTLEHNYQLLQHLEHFHVIDSPLLIGVSRKSMINNVLKTRPEDALNGTSVLNTVALTKGAQILRVHDVKEAAECVKLISRLRTA